MLLLVLQLLEHILVLEDDALFLLLLLSPLLVVAEIYPLLEGADLVLLLDFEYVEVGLALGALVLPPLLQLLLLELLGLELDLVGLHVLLLPGQLLLYLLEVEELGALLEPAGLLRVHFLLDRPLN